MKKRYYALLAILGMLLVLAGCNPGPTPPISQLSEMRGQIALLTLNPKPSSTSEVERLGFTALMPYAGIVSGWTGNLISIPNRPGTIIRFTGDESDCRKHSPQKELEKYRQMKAETPDIPVGFNLNGDIGCGLKGTAETIAEYKRAWIEAINQTDFVLLNLYPYRTRWPDPVATMQSFYDDWVSYLTVPIIPVIQAHWGYSDTTEPNPMEQVKFWFDKGFTGYVVYCWADRYHGVRDMQEEWEEANKWFLSQIK